MKNMRKLAALILTGILIAGMGMNVYAADASVSVKKNLELADGITVPTAQFEFEAKALTQETGMPSVTIDPIAFGAQTPKGNKVDGKYVVSQTAAVKFTGSFPHAGEYVYEIKEKPNTYVLNGTESMSYSTDVYHMHVYVVNGATEGALEIQSIVVKKNPAAVSSGTKTGQIEFTNTYGKDTALSIKKVTEGTFADKTKTFRFQLTFTKAPTAPAGNLIGKIGNDSYTFQYGQMQEFSMKHGQEMKFNNIPAGTSYTVSELGAEDHYVPSVDVVENGTQRSKVTKLDKEAVTAQDVLAGEGQNSVTFINTYSNTNIPITGVFTDNGPFLVMIAVAATALIGMIFMKRRKSVGR